MNIKANIVFTLILVFIAPNIYSFTYYHKGKTPTYLLDQGNRFTNKNIYGTKDNLNAYSKFQNPYSPYSARTHAEKWGHHIRNSDGKSTGIITQYSAHPNSITNPYGKHGSVYNQNHPGFQYNIKNPNNPYSIPQSAYHNKSFRHDGKKYGLQYNDSYGNNLGANHTKSYLHNSIPDTYNHSPYEADNIHHPYSKNKIFN